MKGNCKTSYQLFLSPDSYNQRESCWICWCWWFYSARERELTFLCGHLVNPCFLHIFFKTVGQIPSSLAAQLIGRWKYWASLWILVFPFFSCKAFSFISKLLLEFPESLQSCTDLLAYLSPEHQLQPAPGCFPNLCQCSLRFSPNAHQGTSARTRNLVPGAKVPSPRAETSLHEKPSCCFWEAKARTNSPR